MKDGKVVGRTTSAGYGHRLGRTIAFGYVPAELARENDFQIETFGKTCNVTRGRRCLYDPKMERLRG